MFDDVNKQKEQVRNLLLHIIVSASVFDALNTKIEQIINCFLRIKVPAPTFDALNKHIEQIRNVLLHITPTLHTAMAVIKLKQAACVYVEIFCLNL